MSSSNSRPSLQCPCCGKWFALFHARPDVSSIAELPATFHAGCRECGDVANFARAAITLRHISQSTGGLDPAPQPTRCGEEYAPVRCADWLITAKRRLNDRGKECGLSGMN